MDLLLSGLRVMSVGGRNWAIVIAGCGSARVARMLCANRPTAGREAMRFIFSILFITVSFALLCFGSNSRYSTVTDLARFLG